MSETNTGILMVISAPLGVGKTTLCQALLDRHPEAQLGVSCTSRPPRPREVDGHDFFFISAEEFRRRARAGEFLEWVNIGGHLFGTPKKPALDHLYAGRDVILNLDVRGAASVKEAYPEAVSVFVCPPTWSALADRLAKQGTGWDNGPVAEHLNAARRDAKAADKSDYFVVNDELVNAAEDLSAILRAERRRAGNARGDLARFLKSPFPSA